MNDEIKTSEIGLEIDRILSDETLSVEDIVHALLELVDPEKKKQKQHKLKGENNDNLRRLLH